MASVCRSLADLAREAGDEPAYDEEVRRALADLLADVADAVEAYGQLVGSEVVGTGPHDERLRDALGRAWQDRHRLAELLRGQERLWEDQWSVHGALTSHVDRLLRDVDSDARAELRRSWPQPPTVPASMAVLAEPVQRARSRLRRPRGAGRPRP